MKNAKNPWKLCVSQVSAIKIYCMAVILTYSQLHLLCQLTEIFPAAGNDKATLELQTTKSSPKPHDFLTLISKILE